MVTVSSDHLQCVKCHKKSSTGKESYVSLISSRTCYGRKMWHFGKHMGRLENVKLTLQVVCFRQRKNLFKEKISRLSEHSTSDNKWLFRIWSLRHLQEWVRVLCIKGRNRKPDDTMRCWLGVPLCHR